MIRPAFLASRSFTEAVVRSETCRVVSLPCRPLRLWNASRVQAGSTLLRCRQQASLCPSAIDCSAAWPQCSYCTMLRHLTPLLASLCSRTSAESPLPFTSTSLLPPPFPYQLSTAFALSPTTLPPFASSPTTQYCTLEPPSSTLKTLAFPSPAFSTASITSLYTPFGSNSFAVRLDTSALCPTRSWNSSVVVRRTQQWCTSRVWFRI